jgi:2-phosphoglycerate kinase
VNLPDLANIYWIGGAPCSGKSTIAERLAFKYGYSLFKSDDHMYAHMRLAKAEQQPVMTKVASLSWEEIWTRPVEVQVRDEFDFYREEFAMLLDELALYPHGQPILAEGNAWLPELIGQLSIKPGRIVYVVPTKEFQVANYSQRGFIKDILSQCADPQAAFENWMERDARFGEEVSQKARQMGLPVILVDGRLSIEENAALVEKALNLAG